MPSQKGSADRVDITFAVSPCDMESVPGLVREINSLNEGLTADKDGQRIALLAQARALVRALETPQETMLQHLWGQGTTLAALATGVEIGLFKYLVKDGGRPKKATDIAAALNIDSGILSRLLRHIAAVGHLIETGPDEYKPNRFTTSLTIPEIGDGYPQNLDYVLPALRAIPQYIAELGNKQSNPAQPPFQRAHNTSLSFFEYLATVPGLPEQFANHMAGSRHAQQTWADPTLYPVQESLVNGADTTPNAVLLVDVGGSRGHDISEFNTNHPDVPGRLVLQDLPSVIETVKDLDKKIEPMAHDFFTEQPVKGARAYYMHSVLHDWSDDQCGEILARTKEAMKPGYSKLLLNENVILSTNASWRVTALDLSLFALLGARERAEKDWRSLIEGAGLKICRIWSPANGMESLIECEIA